MAATTVLLPVQCTCSRGPCCTLWHALVSGIIRQVLYCLAKGSFALLPQSSTGATARVYVLCRSGLMQFPGELQSTLVCTPCIMTRGGGKMLSTSSLKGGLGTRLGVIGVEGWRICPLGQARACASASSLLVLKLALRRLCVNSVYYSCCCK